ncbi:hypothetical protein AgCh_014940 [Apium graveolens]
MGEMRHKEDRDVFKLYECPKYLGLGGKEADKLFSLEDLNADYGRNYRRTNVWNGNKENVVVDRTVADHSGLSSSSIRSTRTGILTESTPNIVRMLGKRTKVCDLPRSNNFNKTAAKCSSPVVTPRSNSRGNYMNPPDGSHNITPLSDVTNLGSASFPNKIVRGKENFLGFGRELFADDIVTDDEEESNDFNEGPNVVTPSVWYDDSDGSEYEASGCELSGKKYIDGTPTKFHILYLVTLKYKNANDANYLSGSHESDDEDSINEMNSESHLTQNKCVRRRVILEVYASLGAPTVICLKCHARMWKEEMVNKNVTKRCPTFSLCCMKGAVRLPPIPHTPLYLLDLYNDKKKGPAFHRLIRLYNAIFAFTSIAWVSVQDRQSVDKEVIRGFITMLDETNQLVGEFRQQRDLYESDEIVDQQITLKVIRSESGRECHISRTDEVAAIMVGNTEETCGDRDIVVSEKSKGLVRVSYVHPRLMALQYPLLFPRGEDGFHPKIKFQKIADSSCKPGGFCL